ncbi:Ssk22p [Rhizophagus irregularis DAOM 197198w]|uniref:Ssk22p n=1 Tax=Rhizophagus irregularis (strain DAOM 197198w) TaxID=1432141 RepID=A0A015L848_RHIIW|nr:Ssk22p [Rhizophagus irregularis DAOM 197198w]
MNTDSYLNMNNYQGHKFIPKELKDCPECGKPRISFRWCKDCETNSMKESFLYWTSENKEIDELIRHTQLNASQTCDYLEWIPFEKFEMLKYIGSGGFSSVYSALWLEGPRWNWDDDAQEWTRAGPTYVALRRLDNSLNISSSYIDQIKTYHNCLQSASLAEIFGITKDPTSIYMIVMKYYENGNLYQYLDRSNGILSWRDMIDMLWGIVRGLERIHAEGQIYGVLPYIAPEVLRGENYTPASDIYSLGIIMNTLATEKRPWYNREHDYSLAKDICNGLRPAIPDDIPEFYADLMQQCWSNEPENRPTASLIYKRLSWNNLFCDYDYYDEKKRYRIHPHPKIHPEAYYTSRLLYFPELSNMIINQIGLS